MFPLEKPGVAKHGHAANDNAWASDPCAQHIPRRANQSRRNERPIRSFSLTNVCRGRRWRAATCKLHLAALRAPSVELWVRLPVRDLRRVGQKS